MTNYIINVSKPFSSYINYETLYKDGTSFGIKFLTTDVSKNYLNSVCNSTYNNIMSVRANYEVKGIVLPANDECVNSSKQGIHFKRAGNNMSIVFNTNDTSTLILNLITHEVIKFSNSSTEEYDSFNKTKSSDTTTITIFSNTTNDTIDEFELSVEDEVIIFINYNDDLTKTYAGKTPLAYNCGQERTLSRKSYYTSYALLEELKIIVNYGVEVFWQ